jgi:hypothetical protein
MQNQPELALDSDRDTFADAAQFAHDFALDIGQRRLGGTQQKGSANPHADQRLPDDASFEGAEIGADVGKFGHGDRMHGEALPRQCVGAILDRALTNEET